MSAEPMTLFARTVDPAGVARLLRERAQSVAIDGPDEEWANATVTLASQTLTFTHDPNYYAEPNWSMQMNGMAGYFSRFPETQRKNLALLLPSTFKFSLGLLLEPDLDSSDDARLELIYAVAELLDGVIFTPSALRDARGRILYGAAGEVEEDPDAVWPRVIAEVQLGDFSQPESTCPQNSEGRPSALRVARRALALTAVTARAILEQGNVDLGLAAPGWNPILRMRHLLAGQPSQHERLLKWMQLAGIQDEYEPEEWEILQRPPGRLEQRQQISATWRLEGLAVLAWALKRFEIPLPYQLVECHSLWQSLGILDLAACKGMLADASIRPLSELQALRRRLLAINWRITDFFVRPIAIDFVKVTESTFGNFDQTSWFSPQEVANLPLIDGDLAIHGVRIDNATPDELTIVRSIAHERHLAAIWLCEGSEVYSDTQVHT